MPRIVDHNHQRSQLLAQCFELFAERGYASVSVRHAADALDVSTGTLYHYFGSKEGLFEAMILWLSERDIGEATLDIPEEASQAERAMQILSWIGERQEYLRRVLLLAMDFQRQRPDPAGQALVQDIARTYREAFELHTGGDSAAWALVLGDLISEQLEPSPERTEAHLRALMGLLANPGTSRTPKPPAAGTT